MDDDDKQPPLEFCNQVIDQFADHLLGESSLKPRDYLVIRTTFRKVGGSWFDLCHGSIQQLMLLSQTVKAWNKLKSSDSTSKTR